jgi:hypothetical protein
MWVAVKLVFRHYQPEELEAGMLFMNILYPGNEDREQVEIWELSEQGLYKEITPELMFMENGFPVKPYLVDEENRLVATPDELGWFDPGYRAQELIEFGVTEMNFILAEFDGLLEVFVNDDALEQGELDPVFEGDWVIMRFLTDDEDAEELYLEEE